RCGPGRRGQGQLRGVADLVGKLHAPTQLDGERQRLLGGEVAQRPVFEAGEVELQGAVGNERQLAFGGDDGGPGRGDGCALDTVAEVSVERQANLSAKEKLEGTDRCVAGVVPG